MFTFILIYTYTHILIFTEKNTSTSSGENKTIELENNYIRPQLNHIRNVNTLQSTVPYSTKSRLRLTFRLATTAAAGAQSGSCRTGHKRTRVPSRKIREHHQCFKNWGDLSRRHASPIRGKKQHGIASPTATRGSEFCPKAHSPTPSTRELKSGRGQRRRV